MVRKFSKYSRFVASGFTLIELMVVIAVMGMLSVMAFYANRSFNQGQAVKNAQLGFLSTLRSVQTAVDSGANGDPYQVVRIPGGTATYYEVFSGFTSAGFPSPKRINLPNNVQFASGTPARYICFANPNFLTTYPTGYHTTPSPAMVCGSCTGTVFSCPSASSITVNFTSSADSSYDASVVVEGSGLFVTKMYAQ